MVVLVLAFFSGVLYAVDASRHTDKRPLLNPGGVRVVT